MTKSGTMTQRRRFAKTVIDRCTKPSSGRILLGYGGDGAVFRVAVHTSRTATQASGAATGYVALRLDYNWDSLESTSAQKELCVLIHVPEHRNIQRVLFECRTQPPLWMV